MPPARLGSSRWRLLYWGGWWQWSVASVTAVSALCRFCRDPVVFNKASVKSGVVIAGLGRHWRTPEPVLLADRSADPWDSSADPGGHPHDTSPRNWKSLIGQHGASAGSFPHRSLTRVVPGMFIRLESRRAQDPWSIAGRLGTCRLPDRAGWGLSHSCQPVSGSLELEPLEIWAQAPLVCEPQQSVPSAPDP
jgi:hypothetical protein